MLKLRKVNRIQLEQAVRNTTISGLMISLIPQVIELDKKLFNARKAQEHFEKTNKTYKRLVTTVIRLEKARYRYRKRLDAKLQKERTALRALIWTEGPTDKVIAKIERFLLKWKKRP